MTFFYMIYLPPEIVNYIFMFIQDPTNKLMKYVIKDCYEEDYDPFADMYNDDGEIHWYDNYCFEYSFIEWYFYIEKIIFIKGKKKRNINILQNLFLLVTKNFI